MTVIMSTVNNLLDGAFGPVNDEQAKWLKKLVNHTANLEKLLGDILALMKSQADAGTPVLSHDPPRTGVLRDVPTVASGKQAVTHKRFIPKILIVDDEPDVLDVIDEGLKMKGFETVTAADGDEAVRLAIETKPDLVLMDVLLGGQNGMDVCHRIKTKVTSFLPVILMTGQDDLREKVSGAANEADDLLSKPFQIAELFARVSSMLKIKELTDTIESYRKDDK
jgi:CheY-like chemotaxis protein